MRRIHAYIRNSYNITIELVMESGDMIMAGAIKLSTKENQSYWPQVMGISPSHIPARIVKIEKMAIRK